MWKSGSFCEDKEVERERLEFAKVEEGSVDMDMDMDMSW